MPTGTSSSYPIQIRAKLRSGFGGGNVALACGIAIAVDAVRPYAHKHLEEWNALERGGP
jgi:hypothetical protein